jgi:flagellar biosynthesis protein FlhA
MKVKSSTLASGEKTTKFSDIILAVIVAGILFVLLFPVNVFVIDVLLAISISLSVLILMTSLFIEKPLELSIFPTILLMSAVLRLAMNISSTRLILTHGHKGTAAAGHVIEAFGNFVMSGNIVIGLIVFGIITIINFIVITKGSGRIAEVAARFSLDAMPGKQMAIDADLSAGLIDEKEAKQRRKELEDESSFYGSMDGANKFVRGDAIAGLLITFINLIGGIIIGVVQKDLPFNQALQTYSLLSIGDGIVSQVPALIVSLAAGLLVSKGSLTGSTDKIIFKQFSKFPTAMYLASWVMGLMAFMPGIPAMHFLVVAGVTALLASFAKKITLNDKEESSTQVTQHEKEAAIEKEEKVSEILKIDNISLELGYNLLTLVNAENGSKLPDQVKALRKQLIKDYGFVLPSVRINDNIQLNGDEYVIYIKNIECARGIVKADKLLIMNPLGSEILINGDDTKDPTFGLPAKWINEEYKEEAQIKNYTIVDPSTVITTHLTEIIKENITELLSYSETQKLVTEIEEEHKKLVSDVIPSKVSITTLQRVLQNLLAESVSIRDLPLIIETLSEVVTMTKSVTLMTEAVRAKLARQISYSYIDQASTIKAIALSPFWEKEFRSALVDFSGEEKQLSMEPTKVQEFVEKCQSKLEEYASQGISPLIIVSPGNRAYVRSIVERFSPATAILSQHEIHHKIKIKILDQI